MGGDRERLGGAATTRAQVDLREDRQAEDMRVAAAGGGGDNREAPVGVHVVTRRRDAAMRAPPARQEAIGRPGRYRCRSLPRTVGQRKPVGMPYCSTRTT
eukprot:SAG11_NODE_17792_length_508_cov_1.916870_1_plen_99_part_10